MPPSTDDALLRAQIFTAVIEFIVNLTPQAKSIRLRMTNREAMNFKAGQHVQILMPVGDKTKKIHYSIASAPTLEGSFELCVTMSKKGPVSDYISRLKEKDEIQGIGPMGRFQLSEPVERDVVFIAAGSGIAPLRSMIYDLLAKGISHAIYLIFGNRFRDDILYRKEWEELSEKHKNFKHFFVLSRENCFLPEMKGYVQNHIESLIHHPSSMDFYVCGQREMVEATTTKLLSLGVPPTHVHYEG